MFYWKSISADHCDSGETSFQSWRQRVSRLYEQNVTYEWYVDCQRPHTSEDKKHGQNRFLYLPETNGVHKTVHFLREYKIFERLYKVFWIKYNRISFL